MNEKIKAYSSTITAVFSALVVLYGVFKFIETSKQSAVTIKEIKTNQHEMIVKIDSIENIVRVLKGKTNEIITGQNALRNSYVTLVKKTVRDRDFFIELLNGIQWIVSPIEDKRSDDSVNFQIKIRKK